MKKCLVLMLLMSVEVITIPILSQIYINKGESYILAIIIILSILTLLTAIGSILLFKDNDKKKDNSKNCPYFIEKYDPYDNPEYIDKGEQNETKKN